MTTLTLTENNNNSILTSEQIVQLVSEVVCFSRLANLSWSDEANAFRPFINNDIIVKSFYDGEPDIVFLFEKLFINGKDYYRINPNLPKWVTSIIKKLVFKAGFSITTETFFEDFINQISTNLNYE